MEQLMRRQTVSCVQTTCMVPRLLNHCCSMTSAYQVYFTFFFIYFSGDEDVGKPVGGTVATSILRIPTPGKIRWWSLLKAKQRLYVLRNSYQQYVVGSATDPTTTENNRDQQMIMADMIDFMGPIADLSYLFETSTYTTIAVLLPQVRKTII